jgi:hypothetical protein
MSSSSASFRDFSRHHRFSNLHNFAKFCQELFRVGVKKLLRQIHPAGGPPLKRPTAITEVACPQGGQTTPIFNPYGHPTPYAYDTYSTKEDKGENRTNGE